MLAWVTLAVIAWRLPGVLKPAGVSMLSTEVPAAFGSKAVFFCDSLPLNTTGLVVIVPTMGLLLVTLTLTGLMPARSVWMAEKVSVVGSRAAGRTVRLVFAARLVVVKLGTQPKQVGKLSTKP